MNPQPRYRPGDKIGGRYQVHQALMGGMGEVYLCLDLEEMIPLALKTFQQRYLGDIKRLRAAFEQEVATWVALEKHPNIVRCFYMDTLDNQPFMILEWIAGEEGKGADLRGWLRHGPLELRTALDFSIDMCPGLIHAQEKQPGIVHRDLKPENILVAQGPLAKITDLGQAQIGETAGLEIDEAGREGEERQSMVGRGGIAGTPAYMAPEQWRGESLDERTDIYALGCILYEMLSGHPPVRVDFAPATPQAFRRWLSAMQTAHESGPPPVPPPGLPDELSKLLGACLAKGRAQRPGSLAELLARFEALYRGQFGIAPRTAPVLGQFTSIDYANRGNTYRSLRRYDEALRDHSRAIELDPTFAQAYSNRGVTYRKLQRYNEALADFDRAIQLAPSLAEAFSNRGNVYRDLQQYTKALADQTEAIRLSPIRALPPAPYLNRGVTYQKLQRYDEALADYSRAIKIEPNWALPHDNRAGVYSAMQRYEEALADHNRAIELDPNNAEAYTNRGSTYRNLQRYEEALADLNQAIELDPHYARAYSERFGVHSALHQYEVALDDMNEAIRLVPTDASVYNNRANTYTRLQRYEEALIDYNHSIELDPTLAAAYYGRANVYNELQQYKQALADCNQAIEIDPRDAMAYTNRSNSYTNLQQYEKALADCNQAIDLDPTLAMSYNNRGAIYSFFEKYDEALVDLDRAVELDSSDFKAYFNRGNVYHKLHQYEKALADFNNTTQLNPAFALGYLFIGVVLSEQGNLYEALPRFEKAAQLGDPLGAQLSEELRQILNTESKQQANAGQRAFDALLRADSLDEMRQVVSQFPFLTEAGFIASIEQTIVEQAPPERLPAFEQRLAWLRQVASNQQREERNQ
jgi:tetratricopeptide (TPR) repeat protein